MFELSAGCMRRMAIYHGSQSHYTMGRSGTARVIQIFTCTPVMRSKSTQPLSTVEQPAKATTSSVLTYDPFCAERLLAIGPIVRQEHQSWGAKTGGLVGLRRQMQPVPWLVTPIARCQCFQLFIKQAT